MSPIWTFISGVIFLISSDFAKAYPAKDVYEYIEGHRKQNEYGINLNGEIGGELAASTGARYKRQESSLQQTLQNLQNTQQQQSQAQRRPGQGGFNQNGGGGFGQNFNNQGGGNFGNTRPRPGQGNGNGFGNGGGNFGTGQNGFNNGGGNFGTGQNGFSNGGGNFGTNQGGLNNGGGNGAGGTNNNQGGGQGWTTVRNTFNIPIDETNVPEAECIRQCPSLANYNPVCGSDNITYNNEQRFRCAQQCGRQVQMVFRGTCVTTQAPRTK